jgi:predicted HTH transcriptional regulator
MLSSNPELAKKIILCEKPTISEDSGTLEPQILDKLTGNISMLSSVYYRQPDTFVKKIRDRINGLNLNERQRAMLNRMSQETDKPISSSVWASHTNCSQDSAGRDIHDLLERNILLREPGGGRSTSYSLNLQGLVQ